VSYGDFWIVQVRPSRAPREFQELYQDWRRHERLVLPPPEISIHFEHNPDWANYKLNEETKKELARWSIVGLLVSNIAPAFGSLAVLPLVLIFYTAFWWVPAVYERLYWWRFERLDRISRGIV
jgi:hypothetical protein